MYFRKSLQLLFLHFRTSKARLIQKRYIQVSVVGSGTQIGTKLALLLKRNAKIRSLVVHDDDQKVHGLAMEMNQIPGGPVVNAYDGVKDLATAIGSSNIIVMVAGVPRSAGVSRDEMLQMNAPPVLTLCKAVAENNPNSFLAIYTNPINCLLPFASAVLYRQNNYNPFKVFGITHIDSCRARCYAAKSLHANPRHIRVPVVGGHSEQTTVPLFSNLTPDFYTIDVSQADVLTRLVRKTDTEVMNMKGGEGTAITSTAWAVNEFVEGLVEAIHGNEVELHSFGANPHYGTRFFAGPTTVGPYGIVSTCTNFKMNNLECGLLSDAVNVLNYDIHVGEHLCSMYE